MIISVCYLPDGSQGRQGELKIINNMSLDDLREARIKKLKELKTLKINAYPIYSERTFSFRDAIANSEKLIQEKKILNLVGRVRSLRSHGSLMFLHLEDESGKIQLFFKKDLLGDKSFNLFHDVVDVGDFIEAKGAFFTTKTNELTLKVQDWKILTKSIRPLSDEWFGLKDKELRFRKRYLDLLSNRDLKERIRIRSRIITCLRDFLNQEGFLEVETPILQNQAGGAIARPFKTKLNALDIDLYLRIAPELYLKRLIVGGFEKVYEMAKCFRNEGIDFAHNPEFTMLEFYWAYSDYERLMDFTEKMFQEIFKVLSKKESFNENNLSGMKKLRPFFDKSLPRLEYKDLFQKTTGINYAKTTKRELENFLKKENITEFEKGDIWTLIDEIFKKVCLKKISYPFFLIHHPLSLSPLAKESDKDANAVARFQLIIDGIEIVNAYSELNDPIIQKERFENQQKRIQEGEKEVHPYDKDFIEALEYGMPPTAGWGMGIDRLVALLTASESLKEVILFPLMRPKNKS